MLADARLAPDHHPVADPRAKLQGLQVTLPGGDLPPTLWEAGGCAECSQTGYRGRVGIHEFFPMDVAYHAAIVNGLDMAKLQALAKERGFTTMFHDGLNKSLRGLTTLEEVLRVSQP